jgi:hypothetical protein
LVAVNSLWPTSTSTGQEKMANWVCK